MSTFTTAVDRASTAVQRALASWWCFGIIVGVFALSATLLAVAGADHFLYDEDYHFGIVQVYTHQWLPFIDQGNKYKGLGDISRTGSYLYHYIVSFPVRLVQALGGDARAQLVVARLCSVAFLSASFIWFRSLIIELGASKAIANVSLAVFAAVPITSAVAATVNYDSLTILFTALFLWQAVRIWKAAELRFPDLLAIAAVGCFGSLTKYTFLPVFVGTAVLLLIVLIIRTRRRTVRFSWGYGTPRFWIWGAAALIGVALFVERYVVNLLLFRSPQPDCAKLHPVSFCLSYGPWGRNYALEHQFSGASPSPGRVLYYLFQDWIPGNLWSLRYVGTSTHATLGSAATAALIDLAAAITIFLLAIGIGWLLRRRGMLVPFVAVAVYVAALFAVNLSDFDKMNVPVGVQGRYLLPFLPLAICCAGMVLARALDALYARPATLKVIVVIALVIAMTQGAGALTYFASADDAWYAAGGPLVDFTRFLHAVANKLLIGG
ncbi:DUF2142 domain-containing protein [Humibacter ginsenosidimutans]|uniref:DUF2142 domain-containing protein n=1 Tax=Humibacter ginsenosidimutans TaxID=2599293 RepID=UPI00143DE2BA|nr:DUF2142 domain-containing protein [Humibacter ginsenosidimutans]